MTHRLSGLRAWGCGLLAAALGLAPTVAPGQTRPGADGGGKVAAGPAHSLVFFGDRRPVLIRLRLYLDGKPLSSTHNDYAKKWFDFLDRDGDGVLSKAEASRAPSLAALQQMRANGVFLGVRGTYASPAELSAAGDGKVTFTALAQHFERAGYRALQLVGTNSGSSPFRAAGEALFKHLDPAKTGKLSKEGVRQAAETLLRKLDANDDEILQAAELDPTLGRLNDQRLIALRLGRGLDLPAPPTFYLVRSQAADGELGQRLLTHYDLNKDGKLSRVESGLEAAAFDALDTNRDGQLDADELARWQRGLPDLNITVRLGRKGTVADAIEVRQPRPQAGVTLQKMEDGNRLTLGDANVLLRTGSTTGMAPRLATSQIYLQQFQLADVQNKGYLVEAELTGNGARLFGSVFALMDRDGNGKLTRAEVMAFAELTGAAGRGTMTVSVAEEGRALFQLLDADRDGRLSLRELRGAWERLAALDKNGDGVVSANEIPRQFEVTVSEGVGTGRLFRPVIATRGTVRPPAAQASRRGPLWFRKMDLNGDGDVSRREFLGTSAEFRRIDTDGDGLISVEEAEAHDAKLRPAQAPRR